MTNITEADHDAVDWLYEMGVIAPHHLRLANEAFARHREQTERQLSDRIKALQAECRNANDCAALALIHTETQAREIERLRGALEDIEKAAFYHTLPKAALDIIHKRARAALAGDSHDQ